MSENADWRRRLTEVRDRSQCRITTWGRRTGRRHTVTIWFAAGDGDTIWLSTLRTDRDWPKNVAKNPDVEIEIGDLRLRGEARTVSDEALCRRIEEALRSKYLVARIGGWFGLRPQAVYQVRVSGAA